MASRIVLYCIEEIVGEKLNKTCHGQHMLPHYMERSGECRQGGERSRKREMDVQRVVVKGGGTRKETLALLTVELARETTTSVGLLSSIHPKRTGILRVHASSFAILLASIPSFVMHTEYGLFGFS